MHLQVSTTVTHYYYEKRLGIEFQGLTQSICIQVLPVQPVIIIITGRTGKTLIINIVDLKMHKWITLLDMNELVPHWTLTFTSNMVKNS